MFNLGHTIWLGKRKKLIVSIDSLKKTAHSTFAVIFVFVLSSISPFNHVSAVEPRIGTSQQVEIQNMEKSSAAAPSIMRLTKFSTINYMPFEVRENSTGQIWFSLVLTKQIAKFDPQTRQLKIYSHPINSGNLWWIELDSHDRVWYVTSNADGQDAVGFFNPDTESFTEWSESEFSGLFGLYIEPLTGEVWFTGRGTQPSVFKLIPNLNANPATGNFTRWKIGNYNYPQDITRDGEGMIWVTAPWVDHSLLRLNPQAQSSQLTAWQTTDDSHPPFMVQSDANGIMWFTEHDPVGNSLASFDPDSNTLTEYALPQTNSYPSGLALDEGQVWVNASAASQAVVLDLPASGNQYTLTPSTTNTQVSSSNLTSTVTQATVFPPIQLPAPTAELVPAVLSGSFRSFAYPINNCKDPFNDPYPFTISSSGDGGFWMSSCSYILKLDQPPSVFLPLVTR